ncbi:DUF1214 domain-containing protein [Jeongeupia naejangsanensis]|uniref:DUF1214 domain-containing protein n=1 Tax=Jeongeupia naejangsanensis TaxID=613195 RepID=A0ABS2BFD7_9NEIS|nr:DUF1214 domain-containing protein [Jeongeupia naejangsanensis]MBM3114318.1 DUF1214 domain-containing protein [Jeongeupia naejangsanensis]
MSFRSNQTRSNKAAKTLTLIAGLMLAGLTSAASVLATPEQQALDAKAIQIKKNNLFLLQRGQLAAAYSAAHGAPISSEASASLNHAIDELVFSAIQKAVNNDPLYPKIYWLNAPPRDWFGLKVPGGRYSFDNPDNIYRTIPINGDSRYVIRGQRRGAGPTDVTFSLISNPNYQQSIAVLDGQDLVVAADGSYTITIDNQPANGRVNHIQSTADARQLFVRNNLGDWTAEAADALSVTRLDTPSRPVRGDADIVADARTNLNESTVAYAIGTLGVKTYANPVNTLPQPSSSATLGTLVTQASTFGHFRLADDEALLVKVNTGGAGYFVLPVTDPWTVSVDPDRRQVSLNNVQAVADADGSYTFVVSPRDPGVFNWVETAGLHEGTLMPRWQKLPASTPATGGPAISTKLLKLADLPYYLPAGTRTVTPAERQQQLQARTAGYDQRVATD